MKKIWKRTKQIFLFLMLCTLRSIHAPGILFLKHPLVIDPWSAFEDENNAETMP